jgi:DNA-binding transcriptional LysR family regulator
MSMSIIAARMGFGFGWFPEEKIRDELQAGLLKALPMREGAERFVELYLVYADRDNAGPGTRRLAELLRETVAADCIEATRLLESPDRSRTVAQPAARRPSKRAKT